MEERWFLLGGEKEVLKNELEHYRERARQLEASLQQVREQARAVADERDALRSTVQHLEGRCRELDRAVGEWVLEANKLRDRVKELEEEKALAARIMDVGMGETAKLRGRVQELEKANALLSGRLTNLNLDRAVLEGRVREWQAEAARLRREKEAAPEGGLLQRAWDAFFATQTVREGSPPEKLEERVEKLEALTRFLLDAHMAMVRVENGRSQTELDTEQ